MMKYKLLIRYHNTEVYEVITEANSEKEAIKNAEQYIDKYYLDKIYEDQTLIQESNCIQIYDHEEVDEDSIEIVEKQS